MSTFSVDGLASGLDTSSIIEQLMAVEAQPVRRLESRRDDLTARVNAWTDLDGRLDTLVGAIDDLTEGRGVALLAGQSSNPDVTVTPTGPGSVGVFEFDVTDIAAAHQLMSDRFADPGDLVGAGQFSIASGLDAIGASGVVVNSLGDGGGGPVPTTAHFVLEVTAVDAGTATIVFNGESHDVSSTGGGTITNADGSSVTISAGTELEEGIARVSTVEADGTTTIGSLATELSTGAGAATVQIVDTGDDSATPLTMVITAREPGIENAVTLTQSSPALGTFTELRAASDTIVSMGGGALEITRSDIVVDGIVPGMSVDLAGAEIGETLRIDVSRDTEAIVEKVRTVVDAANSLFSGVSIYGRSDPENDTIGLLAGEFSLRRLERQLRDAFASVGTGSIVIGRQIGIQTTQDGSVSLDETTLTDLVTADFGALETFLVGDGTDDGFLGRVRDAAATAADTDGVVEVAKENLDASIETIEESIATYERRLEAAEEAYRRRFTAMETLLAQLSSQSSFLAGQLQNARA